jgi:hypothetical protein
VSISVGIIVGILIAIGYLVTPVALIWAWISWARQPRQRTIPASLSLTGFVFATASAVLATSSVAYAQVHHFRFTIPCFSGYFDGAVCLPSQESCLESVVCGVRVRCGGRHLFVGWECWRGGCLRRKVSDRVEQRLMMSVIPILHQLTLMFCCSIPASDRGT